MTRKENAYEVPHNPTSRYIYLDDASKIREVTHKNLLLPNNNKEISSSEILEEEQEIENEKQGMEETPYSYLDINRVTKPTISDSAS